MTAITCFSCGIIFGVPGHWNDSRRQDQVTFYCPNGHRQSYTKSTVDLLREQKEVIERALQARINTETHLRLVAEKELASERRKRRKIENRVAKGVCPCCNRTFQDLQRHMSTKHKEFSLPPATPKQITAPESVQ